MGGIEMGSSFVKQAVRSSKAQAPSGKNGSHHKPTDSKAFSPTTPARGEASKGLMAARKGK
jgi:hypothetical protein